MVPDFKVPEGRGHIFFFFQVFEVIFEVIFVEVIIDI